MCAATPAIAALWPRRKIAKVIEVIILARCNLMFRHEALENWFSLERLDVDTADGSSPAKRRVIHIRKHSSFIYIHYRAKEIHNLRKKTHLCSLMKTRLIRAFQLARSN